MDAAGPSQTVAERPFSRDAARRAARDALAVWAVFLVTLAAINGTLPFVLGADLHAWVGSPLKGVLVNVVVYGILFLVVPVAIVKGRHRMNEAAVPAPLAVALIGLVLRPFVPFAGVAPLLAIAFLHRRVDLSGLGIRSRGWRGDLAAIVIVGALGLVVALASSGGRAIDPPSALRSAADRLLLHPTSAELLFYFGFLTERLSAVAGGWTTPLLVAVMYTLHEMSNPEYWYGGMAFHLVFAGVALVTAVYLWRRSVVVVWLADGLARFAMRLPA